MVSFPRIRFIFYSVLAVSVLGCAKEVPPPQAAPPPTVQVITVQSEPVALTRELPGRTNPYLVAEVRPQVTGVIEERLFEEGGLVEQGEVLYQLDDAIYQADVTSARASVARAEAALKLAKLNADRTVGLFESNAVSQQERDDAVAQLHLAEADLEFSRANLASAEVLLGYSRIVSPINGRVGRSSVTKGALVTANQPTALVTVQQLDPIYVDVTQASRELLALRKALAAGDLEEAELPVTLLLEDGTVYEHTGTVAFSEVTVDPSTGSFVLRIVVENPDHLLLPGMYVRAIVGAGIQEEAILVPQKAVLRDASGNATVMLVRDNGTVEQRAVTVRRAVGNDWLVNAGLLNGDRVITVGLQHIQPEMQVQIAEKQTGSATNE